MRRFIIFSVAVVSMALLATCKKEEVVVAGCFPNTSTVRQIANGQATIKFLGAQFFIVPQGTTDTKLAPCNLPVEFQVDNLPVTVSGEVKLTLQGGPYPCCIENFVVTSISR